MSSPRFEKSTVAKTRVVLVDDHVSTRQMLAFVLTLEGGFEVVGQAGDGIEALRLCRDLKPNLLILELALPALAGTQVIRLLRGEAANVRVLVYTGVTENGLLRDAMLEEPEAVVRKEDSLDELRAALQAVAAGRRHISPRARQACPERPSRALARLGRPEVAILQMIAEGRINKEMADALGISPKAVDHHRQRMMECLDLHDVASLTRFAVRNGLVDA